MSYFAFVPLLVRGLQTFRVLRPTRLRTLLLGYGAPHWSARGTSTLLNNALLSGHFRVADQPPTLKTLRRTQRLPSELRLGSRNLKTSLAVHSFEGVMSTYQVIQRAIRHIPFAILLLSFAAISGLHLCAQSTISGCDRHRHRSQRGGGQSSDG